MDTDDRRWSINRLDIGVWKRRSFGGCPRTTPLGTQKRYPPENQRPEPSGTLKRPVILQLRQWLSQSSFVFTGVPAEVGQNPSSTILVGYSW